MASICAYAHADTFNQREARRVSAATWASLVTVNEDPAILLTPPGRELLARLAAEPDAGSLAVAERLRREYPAGLVATAMAQQELRLAAEAKFSRAARDAVHQGRLRAVLVGGDRQVPGRPPGGRASRIADLCCGIGGDLIALAAASDVLAVDRDETHARLALHNAAVYGRAEHVTAVVADVRDVPLAGVDAVFIDPARRSGPGTASARTTRAASVRARPSRRSTGASPWPARSKRSASRPPPASPWS